MPLHSVCSEIGLILSARTLNTIKTRLWCSGASAHSPISGFANFLEEFLYPVWDPRAGRMMREWLSLNIFFIINSSNLIVDFEI